MKNKKSLIYLIAFILCFNTALIAMQEIFEQENFENMPTRSVENFVSNNTTCTTLSKLEFNKTVFDNTNFNFFLGAKSIPSADATNTSNQYSITRAFNDSGVALIKGITPAKILVPNPEEGSNNCVEADNDLYGKAILNLGLFNKIYPIASYQQDPTNPDDSNILYLITAYKDGKMNIKTEEALKDSANAETKQIKALTGSDTYVFAAVSATGKIWEDNSVDGENRGIAVAKPNLTATTAATIKQIAATALSGGSAETQAKNIDVKVAARLVSFSDAATSATQIAKAFIGADVDMYWDSELKRLFIGLSGVHRDDQNKEGGCFSVLVGRIDVDTICKKNKELRLSPILNSPTKTKLYNDATYKNSNEFMVGFYFDGQPDQTYPGNIDAITTAKKVRVMHTSTGKNYLIVNCNVTVDDTYNKVFALPILGSTTPAGKTIIEEKIGTLSKIGSKSGLPTFDSEPTNATEMPKFDESDPTKTTNGIVVGQQVELLNIATLTDLFVHGDSVFVCLNDIGNAQNAGIFQSTALFNENGIIIAWTPWQRVMGDVQRVYGGGVDNLSNFYFLAGDESKPTDSNTIRITQWGTTERVNISETIQDGILQNGILQNGQPVWSKDTTRNLSSLLSKIFPHAQCGVLQIINFDEQTPGFNPKFSMMVAVGYDKVALIQTLSKLDSGPDAGKFVPVKNFELDKNVFVFQNDALKAIAPLCFAEVSRNTDNDSGWLFVGGYNGVAVLSKANGKGWASQGNGLVNLDPAAFPGAEYTFKKLTPSNPCSNFSNVRKLVSLVNNDEAAQIRKLFIQTKDNLYAIEQSPDIFKKSPAPLDEQVLLNNLPKTLKFTDLLIIPNSDDPVKTESDQFKFLFGSTYGLLVGSEYDGTKIDLIDSGSSTFDPALHLHYISKTKGNNSATGNLYALSANFLTNSGKVYRYSVDGSETPQLTLKKITVDASPFIDLYNFRGNFVTDGAFGFSMIARGPSNNFLTDLYQIAQTQTETGSIDDFLELNCSNWYIGVITRNTASGSWIVPGDWGIKVNE